MKELDLDVLAWEGPMLRAYCSILRFSGFRPKRIIRIVDKPPGRHTGEPGCLRRRLWRWRQNRRNNYWVRWGAVSHETFFKQLLREACRCSGLPMEFVGYVYDDLVRKDVCGIFDCPVIDLFAAGFKDPSLRPALEKMTPGAVLFTGGGLLPKEVVAIPNMKIIHIHPGRLPFVRGADGLLYSILLRGRPGASAFYMAPGLDEGDVVVEKEFTPFRIERQRRMDDLTFYRLLYGCVDPLFRASVLLELISLSEKSGAGFAHLPAVPQDVSEGTVFHFMHPWMRSRVFKLMSKVSS